MQIIAYEGPWAAACSKVISDDELSKRPQKTAPESQKAHQLATIVDGGNRNWIGLRPFAVPGTANVRKVVEARPCAQTKPQQETLARVIPGKLEAESNRSW